MEALPSESGFNYDNCLRNKALLANIGMGLNTNISNMKTGTTICGLIYKVSCSKLYRKIINQICVGWSCTCC